MKKRLVTGRAFMLMNFFFLTIQLKANCTKGVRKSMKEKGVSPFCREVQREPKEQGYGETSRITSSGELNTISKLRTEKLRKNEFHSRLKRPKQCQRHRNHFR